MEAVASTLDAVYLSVENTLSKTDAHRLNPKYAIGNHKTIISHCTVGIFK
jgi:hypothetical protein